MIIPPPQTFILKDNASIYHPLVMLGAHQLDRWPFLVWGARLLDARFPARSSLPHIRTVTNLPINLFPRTWISTPFLCCLACSCAGSRRKYRLSHTFRAIFGKESIDVLPRMALTDSLSYQNLGHINSSHLFKAFFLPHGLRLFLFNFICLPPLDLRLQKRSGKFWPRFCVLIAVC